MSCTISLDRAPVPSRRALFGGAALLAGVVVLATAGTGGTVPGAPGPDAELISLCDRLAANGVEHDALLETHCTIEDEERDDAAVNDIFARRGRLLDAIWDIRRPATLPGARGMARAFSAIALRKADGTIMEEGEIWLALAAAEFLADGDAA
jgi:hypothetical protein